MHETHEQAAVSARMTAVAMSSAADGDLASLRFVEAERSLLRLAPIFEQYFHYGTVEWKAAYAMRNGVESAKRSQYEDSADPDKRAVRGNTFTYIVIALATVVENLRQMLSFYKRCLAISSVTPKNRKLTQTFWQSEPTGETLDVPPQPPG